METTITIPKNCTDPIIEMNCTHPELECQSVRGDRENCDCRWCVYNIEFNKAVNNKTVIEEEEEE